MLIRIAEKKDLTECEKLLHIPEMKLATGGFFTTEILEHFLNDECFLVAEKEEVIVGLVLGERIKAGGAVIWMISVSEHFRGNGVGSILMREFEERAKKSGLKWIVLYGDQNDPRVKDFYVHHGFCEGVKCFEFEKNI